MHQKSTLAVYFIAFSWLLLLSIVLIYIFIPHSTEARKCDFFLQCDANCSPPSSAHRITPSPACNPSVSSAHRMFATSCAFMLGATRTVTM
jgi:hypothetical protein